MTKAKLQRNILRPRKMTLGSSTRILWQKIEQFDFSMENLKPTMEGKILVKLKDPISLCNNNDERRARNACESCLTAMKCVKTVAQEIQALRKCESISKARSRMREIIFYASQLEGMNLITNAIVEDLGRLRQVCSDLEHKVEAAEEISRNLKHQCEETARKLNLCQEKISELEQVELKEKERMNALSSLVNKLYHEKQQLEIFIKTKEALVSDQMSTIEKNNEKIYDLRREVAKLDESVLKTKANEEILLAEKELWKIRFTNAHEENLKMKAANRELEKKLCVMECKIGAIGGNLDKLDEKILCSAQDIDKTKQAYETLLKRTQDVVNSKLLEDDKVDENVSDVYPKDDTEVQGHPLIDMSKQIEVNKVTIRKLEAQNERLLKTIRRFQEIACQKNTTIFHT